jgi:hypothetical protein
MIRQLRIIWLRMMMSHSLNCEAAYSRAAAEFRNAAFGAILDGKDPAPWQSSAEVYQALIGVEQDLQREYRGRLIGLGARAEMLV